MGNGYTPFALATVLERAHADLAYPLIGRLLLLVLCDDLQLAVLREECTDRLFSGLEAEVAEEERWACRLFLRPQDLLRGLRVPCQAWLCIAVFWCSGRDGATGEVVA